METIVASLRGSFRQVPSVAIPAMLDCILASTTLSPACLFSALLNDFSDIIESTTQRGETIDCEWHDGVASYVAALSHFLKNYDTCQMSIFIWKILFPLLKLFHASDHKLFSEVVDLFIGVITERNSWKVLESIFAPFLLRSIGLSMGSFQNDKFAIFKCSEKSNFKRLDDHELNQKSSDDFLNISTHKSTSEDLLVSQSYPLTLSCTLLALTLDAAIRNKYKGVVSGSTTADMLQIKLFVGNLLWDLSNLTLQMLTKSLEHRSTAIKFLLPCIFKAFVCDSTFSISVCGRDHVLTRKEYFAEIWKCCKLLFSLGPLERRDAYDILSLYLSFLSSGDEHGDVNVDGKGEAFDLSSDKKFWDEIKRGLLDKETLLRKLSIHILKATLNLSEERRCSSYLEEVPDEGVTDFRMMSKRGRWTDMEARSMGVGRVCNSGELSSTSLQSWEAFIFLYEMLEEYGTHLVEAAWNHQILQLLQSSFSFNTAINCTDERLYRNWMLNSGEIFEWLAVLWERGFCHDNPQVRCLIMQSFLAIEWEKYVGCVRFVPQEFILGPLMQGLNDPIHHRDFGLKEIYSSRTIEATARFLRQYASYLEGRELICFLLDLASVLKKHSFGRAGLMSLAECIASAACGVLEHNIHEIEQSIDGISDKFESSALFSIEVPNLDDQNDKSNLLEAFRFVIECSKKHFNPKYRHQVCAKILAATTTVMTAVDVPLEMLLLFISSMPREYSDNGGSLRYILQKWLRGLDLQLLKSIGTFPENFISCQHPLDAPVAYDDGELEAWVSEARRWARVLFLVAREEHLYPILKFVQDCCGFAFKRNRSSGPVAVKFLILVSSLVLELQVIQERTSKFRVTTRNKGDSVSPMIGDNQCSYEESINFEMFTPLLLTFLEKLVPFAEILCSSFWSAGAMEEVALPGSISGKLGGPSQRRLPTTLCTSVLEAVKSIETLAYVMRWCTQCKTDVLINSAYTFLWNFCWKVIRSPPSKSEVEAEVFLAAYEACAYALKDLVSVASPLLLDLVHESDNSFSSSGGRPLLDAFAITFIHNINNVIDGGHLARTRRAILMNYKWSCLESLLSFPRYALFNGVGSRMHNAYFSDTLVTQILGDLVDSLENAGEGSVLPMLRAIRLCMEHFSSENMDILIFSSNIITVEMMWQLVHSSWILHISHNKRRVAPIAALLSSVLHHSVFGYEHMHELNNASGPLKWFVEKILEEGTKSPRTIRLAALHLSGLWLAYPFTLKYYMKELKLLTLYGSVAFDEDFEAELAENCEARNEVSVLSGSLDPELTEVFINTELYARVSVAVLFSKLAEMANLVEPTVKTEGDPPAIASGKMFLLELLDSVLNDKDLSKELYKKYSAVSSSL